MIRKYIKFFLYSLTGLIFIIGCSILQPVESPTLKQFILSQLPKIPVSSMHSSKTLVVMLPMIFSPFDTHKIAYVNQKQQINYFSRSEWIALPAEMLQLLLIQSLQKTRHFKIVVKPFLLGQYDFALYTWVTELNEDLTGVLPVFKINLQAILFDARHHRVIANRNFYKEIELNNISIQSAMIAANQAVAIILQQTADFCIQETKN